MEKIRMKRLWNILTKHFLLNMHSIRRFFKILFKRIEFARSMPKRKGQNSTFFSEFDSVRNQITLRSVKSQILKRKNLKYSFWKFRANIRGKPSGNLEHTVVYPPNGVIPFHGFAMFCAPFCYVYDDSVQLYLGKYLIWPFKQKMCDVFCRI